MQINANGHAWSRMVTPMVTRKTLIKQHGHAWSRVIHARAHEGIVFLSKEKKCPHACEVRISRDHACHPLFYLYLRVTIGVTTRDHTRDHALSLYLLSWKKERGKRWGW